MNQPITLDFENMLDWIERIFDDYNISFPVPINEHDLTGAWVYNRKYGVFEVPIGYHQAVMAFFYAWETGYEHPFDIPDIDGDYLAKAAELYLTLPGTAYMSGAWHKPRILAGLKNNLNRNELNYFGDIDYILED